MSHGTGPVTLFPPPHASAATASTTQNNRCFIRFFLTFLRDAFARRLCATPLRDVFAGRLCSTPLFFRSQLGVTHTVHRVDHDTDHEPDDEPLPRAPRQRR